MLSCSYRVFVFVLLPLFWGMSLQFLQNLQAQDLSAEEIIAKSQHAMGQPLRYTITSGDGVEMLVYQKALPDGSMAMLTDTQSPINKTTIKYGEKHYDLYLEQQVAIDMSGVLLGVKNQYSSILSNRNSKPTQYTLEGVKIERHNEKECYEVFSIMDQETKETFLAKMPADFRRKFPVKSRLLIDKENYFLHIRETFAEDGSTISRLVYKDIQHQPDLTDDFFQLPPDLEILSPESVKDHVRMTNELLKPKLPPEDFDAEFEKIKKKVYEKYPTHYPEIKLPSVAPPTPLPDYLVKPRNDYPLPEKKKHPWAIIVSINVFFIMCMIWLVYRNKKRRS